MPGFTALDHKGIALNGHQQVAAVQFAMFFALLPEDGDLLLHIHVLVGLPIDLIARCVQ